MKNYYFTFGTNHPHPISGEPMHNGFVTICAPDFMTARELMFKRYGPKWSMQYDDSNFKPHFFPRGSFELIRPELAPEMLKAMEPRELIAYGKVTDHRLGLYPVRWIAVHVKDGEWLILHGRESWSFQRVLDEGSLTIKRDLIRELVPCVDEALELYCVNFSSYEANI